MKKKKKKMLHVIKLQKKKNRLEIGIKNNGIDQYLDDSEDIRTRKKQL